MRRFTQRIFFLQVVVFLPNHFRRHQTCLSSHLGILKFQLNNAAAFPIRCFASHLKVAGIFFKNVFKFFFAFDKLIFSFFFEKLAFKEVVTPLHICSYLLGGLVGRDWTITGFSTVFSAKGGVATVFRSLFLLKYNCSIWMLWNLKQ